jgi:hypothetical protein
LSENTGGAHEAGLHEVNELGQATTMGARLSTKDKFVVITLSHPLLALIVVM